MPGSNPLFGLNTLGGALSVQTKSGHEYPGSRFEAYGGSFGRYAASFETGGEKGRFDYFLTGNWFDEDGWRPLSPSHVRQLFGKAGWEDEKSDVDVSYAFADTNLTGNGLTPWDMLASLGRDAVFTFADHTKNHLNFVNVRGSHFLDKNVLLGGNAYFRQLATRTSNGDLGDDYQDDYENALAPGGACETAPDPAACAAQTYADETGINRFTQTTQRTRGAAAQLTDTADLFRRRNQFVVGLSYDDGHSEFAQESQSAVITPARATQANGPLAADVGLSGSDRNYGLFTTDTLSVNERVHMTVSARYNATRVELDDALQTQPGQQGFAGGVHDYHRVNPALGVNYTPSGRLTLYANYNEGSRAPSPIELGCADPDIPCKLPNAFASDPDLRQVVARTYEAGARGHWLGEALGWAAAVYRTTVNDDIQFISSLVSGAGYFDNVGKTRRQGLELELNGHLHRFKWSADYGYVDATYRTPFTIASPNNSAADSGGNILVPAGATIPEVPRFTGKLIGEYDITAQWYAGANVIMASGSFVRGNENNRHQAGINANGDVFRDSGRTGGYALLNLNAGYHVNEHFELFGRLNNVFDTRYATAGQLASNPFDASGHFNPDATAWTNVTAVSEGVPRAVWAGIRAAFD
jgi:outer membrane receptor protein involved in Fe transport